MPLNCYNASLDIKTLFQTILSLPDSTTHPHCRSLPSRLVQYLGSWCRMTLPHCWNGYGGPGNEPSNPAYHRWSSHKPVCRLWHNRRKHFLPSLTGVSHRGQHVCFIFLEFLSSEDEHQSTECTQIGFGSII